MHSAWQAKGNTFLEMTPSSTKRQFGPRALRPDKRVLGVEPGTGTDLFF